MMVVLGGPAAIVWALARPAAKLKAAPAMKVDIFMTRLLSRDLNAIVPSNCGSYSQKPFTTKACDGLTAPGADWPHGPDFHRSLRDDGRRSASRRLGCEHRQ